MTRCVLSFGAGVAAIFLRQEELSQFQVARGRDFQIARRSHDDVHRAAAALNQRSFVGPEKSIRLDFVERLLRQPKAKALRRLCHHHALARDRGQYHRAIGCAVHLLHRIHCRDSRNRRAVLFHRFDHARDGFVIHERTHRIVYQDDVVRRCVECGQRAGHGILPVFSTFHHPHWLLEALLFNLLEKTGGLVLAQCDHDLVHLVVFGKLAQGVNKNGGSLQFEELLGLALVSGGGHARAQTGCGDDDDYFHKGKCSLNAGRDFIQIARRKTGSPAHKQDSRMEFYSDLGMSGTTAGPGAGFRTSFRGSTGRGGRMAARSSNFPKIILPAVVCNPDVTEMSMFLPIILRALSTTTMVPSSRYATPWLYSLPSFRMNTFMISPGSTMGFSELASSLVFSTATPCNCATLFRLKSLVTILPSYTFASSISFRSTSRTAGKSASTIWTVRPAIFWMRCRISNPRRPRLRFMESAESATSCNSRSTNCGSTMTPSRKPVSAMSAMRPSIMTLVSRIL